MAKNDELPQTSPAEIESLIKQIQASNLEPSTKYKAELLLCTVRMLNISIKRLRNLVFGRRTEERKEVSDAKRKENEPACAQGAAPSRRTSFHDVWRPLRG